MKAPKRDIERFVASHEKWIADKLALLGERLEKRESFALSYGDSIAYRGELCLISPVAGNRVGFRDGRFYMPPDLSPEQIRDACVQIYRLLARRDLTERVHDYAKQMSVLPAAVKINAAKTRWGSCSSKGNLNFSWRLILASDDVIDYVVVHELAHLIEMNHSVRFWHVVASVLPDYRERQKKLKALQHKLSAEDWG